MNCFQKLGVKKSASIQDIKRAYAGKLKQHRPDEDPIGFQDVNTAFKTAIESAKQRDAWLLRKAELEQQKLLAIAEGTYIQEDDDDGYDYYDELEYYFDEEEEEEEEDSGEASAQPVNESEPDDRNELGEVVTEQQNIESNERPNTLEDEGTDSAESPDDDIFRLDDFIEELGDISKSEDDRLLKKWLDNHPDLYSLYLKHQIAEPLMIAFAQADAPLRPRALEVVITFFGLDSVSSNHHWIDHQIEMARRNAKAFWHAAAIAFERKNRKRSLHERWIDESLLGKSNKFKTLYLLIFPGLPTKAMEIANEVRDEHGNYNTEFVKHDSFQFWIDVNDKTRISAQRLVMALIRAAIYPLGMVAWLNFTGMVQNFAMGYGISSGIIFGIWLLSALLRVGNYQLDIYVQRKSMADKGNILLGIALPVIVIVSLAFSNESKTIAMWVLSFFCFSLATTGSNQKYRPAAVFSFFTGSALSISFLSFDFIPELLSGSKFILSACLSMAFIVIHDEIYTRAKDYTFEETREQSGWLVWAGIIFIILSFVALSIHYPTGWSGQA